MYCARKKRVGIAAAAAFYILVAVRALIPDLCQTQRQAKEIAQRASCCAARTSHPEGASGTRIEERQKPGAPCAFCLLAITLVEPLRAVNADSLWHDAVTGRLLSSSTICLSPPYAPWLGRSPPRC